jgi:malate/lactate dehydrogenase
MKVTIVGAGNVGAMRRRISYRGIASEVVLLDIKEGFAEGKALILCNVLPIQVLIQSFVLLMIIQKQLIVMW